MDPIFNTVIITGIVEMLMVPVVVYLVNRAIGKRLDRFDEKREDARAAQARADLKLIEQRDAERTLVLAMTRTMLLNNWEKCMEKGYYTIEEREVYHELYKAYRKDDGNGIIEEIAPRIRALPMELPNN